MAVRKIETEIGLTGEREFNDQMKSVNSNLKTLKSDMALVTSEFQGQANTADALRAKQKVLTDQYDQQQEKVKALERQLQNASDAYGENSMQVDRYQQQLNAAKVQLNGFGRELDDTNRYLKEAEQSANGAADSIDEFGKQVKQSGEDAESANGGGFGGILDTLGEMKSILVGGAIVGALKEVGEAVLDVAKAGAQYADDVLTMSTVTGLATDTLQEYMYMTDLIDVPVETITGALTKLTVNLRAASLGTEKQSDAFRGLGVEITNEESGLRSAEAVFYDVIDALGEMQNKTERDAVAMTLMGKSAKDLNPLIEAGAETIQSFRDEARTMGAVLDDETLGQLGAVQDSFDRLTQQIQISKNSLAVEFAPAIIKIVGEIGAAYEKATEGIIKFWTWATQTKIGVNTDGSGKTKGSYSNISGGYTDPDEEYYGLTNENILSDIWSGTKTLSGSSGSTKSAAAQLASAGSAQPSSVNVTLKLDGKTLARETVDLNRNAAELAGNVFIS